MQWTYTCITYKHHLAVQLSFKLNMCEVNVESTYWAKTMHHNIISHKKILYILKESPYHYPQQQEAGFSSGLQELFWGSFILWVGLIKKKQNKRTLDRSAVKSQCTYINRYGEGEVPNQCKYLTTNTEYTTITTWNHELSCSTI